MRLNELLHLAAFPRKAHGKPPASGYATAAKMPEPCGFSNSSGQFHSIHTPVRGASSLLARMPDTGPHARAKTLTGFRPAQCSSP